jgi:CO dehydrogenase maturation factor
MCGSHATVRGFLGELVSRSQDTFDVVVDMEAGLEHLSRGTGRHVERFFAVVEPYFRSMETARRVADLARELGVTDVSAVINKVRNAADREAVTAYCQAHDIPIVAEIPYDGSLVDAERAGQPPLDFDLEAPAVAAIRALSRRLVEPAAVTGGH